VPRIYIRLPKDSLPPPAGQINRTYYPDDETMIDWTLDTRCGTCARWRMKPTLPKFGHCDVFCGTTESDFGCTKWEARYGGD
jgi:hypothetical protein